MALIFVVLSMLAWLWAREAATPHQWRLRHLLTILLVLFAVLSKPIAVILPALFVAYEFCSGPHAGIARWRLVNHRDHPLVTRMLGMTVILVLAGGLSTAIFRRMLQHDREHGGWLILVLLGLALAMMAAAPKPSDFLQKKTAGMRIFGPPFAILSVVAGAGSAWAFWSQSQAGAIKGAATFLATLNLICDAILSYFGRALIPARMSISHTWGAYPSVSVSGLLGAALLCLALGIGVRLAGSADRNRRLMAFGIFWFLIALIPVSNLVPMPIKMADRYLFLPTIGTILGILALAASWCSDSRRRQLTTCAGLVLVTAVFAAWSYARAEVWCGKTTLWHDRPQPELSLWTSAVETDPEDTNALTGLGGTYLYLDPPDVDRALENLNHALRLSEANQSKNAGGKQLALTEIYHALGDGYLARAFSLVAALPGQSDWQKRKEAYLNSVKYYRMAFLAPTGFAPLDVIVHSRFSDACEGLAQMETAELGALAGDARVVLQRERDSLRAESEQEQRQARALLATAHVSPMDPAYRETVLQQGNVVLNREIGASNQEKASYDRQALVHYQEAASLFPDDPRPFYYEGLCYEHLAAIEQSPEDKQQQFVYGQAALRKAMSLRSMSSDYNPSMPLLELAVLDTHVGDYRGALDSLHMARQVGPAGADAATIDKNIQILQAYLQMQNKKN